MKSLALFLVVALAVGLTACSSAPKAPEQAYIVNSHGATSIATRSALDGSPAPGRQEIIALYLPPIPGIPGAPDFRAGITMDPSALQFPIIISPPLPGAQAAPYCAGPQYIDEQVTEMVPETRMVPRTRTVRKVVVPAPQAAPQAAPTNPCPEPPQACIGEDCELPMVAQR